MKLSDLWPLILRTATDPAGVAHVVLSLRLARADLWQALILVCTLSALLLAFGTGSGAAVPFGDQQLLLSPIGYAGVLAIALTLTACGIHFAGRILNGVGQFEDALAAVVWIEAVALVFGLAQLVARLFGASVETAVAFIGVAILIWALVNFVNVLHRFDSLPKSGGALILGIFGMTFALSFFLAIFGAVTGLTLPSGV